MNNITMMIPKPTMAIEADGARTIRTDGAVIGSCNSQESFAPAGLCRIAIRFSSPRSESRENRTNVENEHDDCDGRTHCRRPDRNLRHGPSEVEVGCAGYGPLDAEVSDRDQAHLQRRCDPEIFGARIEGRWRKERSDWSSGVRSQGQQAAHCAAQSCVGAG